ncbi:urea transporter [Providencia stuartii]|uniref:urea transporter n=1 Tax=Providencia TaxID=586 RepID=UPI00069CEA7C|nr:MULTISPECIES: urea transporter [Providencia]AMG65397.1 urea transporter [Providencia stuartii]EMD1717739.1 urea transporter [Providencia stuartii]KNZ84709.1 urea transporter [Providencia stuartii]MBG5908903.1 urea transporter [Providencia stuartii]MDN0017662.1 urea transporter [Providencia stuartii]
MNTSTINKNAWNQLADKNITVQFIDVTLRGCAQVMFQNNPLTGLLFFIAIFIGAFLESMPAVAFGCLLGTVVSTLTAYISKLDTSSLRSGLYGYNGCLVGVALPTFLENTPFVWLSIILGSIVSVIATISLMDFLKNWKVAALTAPFVLVSWTILLASYSFLGIKGVALPAPALPQQFIEPIGSIPHSDIVADIFRGISEVFLLSSVIVGIIFVIGLAVSSIWAAVFAIVGSLLAFIIATLLKGDFVSIHTGLYSFSAVLTAIALGSTFNKPSYRVVVYAIIGVIFTVFVQGALDIILEPFGIPTLTMPFVLASWLFLVPNQDIMPEHRQS